MNERKNSLFGNTRIFTITRSSTTTTTTKTTLFYYNAAWAKM